jgi:hypothetical protein
MLCPEQHAGCCRQRCNWLGLLRASSHRTKCLSEWPSTASADSTPLHPSRCLQRYELHQLCDLLRPLRVFPTTCGRWASLAEGLLVDDDSGLAALFEGQQGVAFLKVPPPAGTRVDVKR